MKQNQHGELLSDEQLCIAIVDRENLSEEVRKHIEHCEQCQKQVDEYTQLHSALLATFYRRYCPDSMKLSMYCAHHLPSEEMTRIAFHVQECPLCATEVKDTLQFYKNIEGVL